MELIYMIAFFLGCFGVAFNMLFLLPRYIYKRVKADNFRDAHHYEVSILLTLVLAASCFIIVLTSNALIKWP